MNIKRQIKNAFIDSAAKVLYWHHRRAEIKKFQDPKRVNISKKYPLTEEQKCQINEFYYENYGERINYVWHQNYAAHASKFDYRFIPELIYIPEFEAFQNQNRAAVRMMGDKNFLPLIAKAAGLKMPRTIVSCTNGLLRDEENRIITEKMANELLKSQDSFFIKPSVDSCSGQGCMKVDAGSDYRIIDNAMNVGDSAWGGGYFHDYVVQELVTCHDSIRKLYSGSVNTFRVITYLWLNKVEIMPIIIRIGQGGKFLDNAHAGGMFCAVYNDGTMGDHAVTEFNDQFVEHPDTHVKFANHKIEHVDRVIEAAKKMHEAIPQIGVVNWDFTINESGEAVLIEANVKNGSVWLPQMAHGVGPFGERTAKVLRWLRFMKHIKAHERAFFSMGRME